MFNSPLLDVTIGLVFIFLLYSLLVTSINEAIATLFGLRARMLKKAIIKGMLSDTSKDNTFSSIVKAVKELLSKLSSKQKKEEKIGDKFYDFPLIKNYGSNRIFSLPSFIPTKNFSTVLIEVLKENFNSKLDQIVQYKLGESSNTDSKENIYQKLNSSIDIIKIKELLDYYKNNRDKAKENVPLIDKETVQILQMHLNNSIFSIEKFILKIENWYDDSMKQVTDWYKRQTQMMLFIIGIVIAVTFNVDTIQIVGKLSVDKDARDKFVQLAVQSAENYRNDLRVKRYPNNGQSSSDSTNQNDPFFKEYKSNIDSARKLLTGDILTANTIIALGWGDYGKVRDSARVLSAFKNKIISSQKDINAYNFKDAVSRQTIVDSLYKVHFLKYKAGYVLKESFHVRKLLGFLLTAIAISLGAPFWFDLLKKLVKMRGSDKKVEEADSGNDSPKSLPGQIPITLNLNTQKPGEEATG